MNKIITIVILTFLCHLAIGQTCRNFHLKRPCSKSQSEFKLYGQSKSALMEIDSTKSYPVIFYGKKDYIVTVCSERGFYPIRFRIIETESGNVFYDNMNDDYYESIGFTIDVTQKVKIEITLLAEGASLENFGDTQACVGVNIQWKKAAKIGF